MPIEATCKLRIRKNSLLEKSDGTENPGRRLIKLDVLPKPETHESWVS
jgi:hypothetical protein